MPERLVPIVPQDNFSTNAYNLCAPHSKCHYGADWISICHYGLPNWPGPQSTIIINYVKRDTVRYTDLDSRFSWQIVRSGLHCCG